MKKLILSAIVPAMVLGTGAFQSANAQNDFGYRATNTGVPLGFFATSEKLPTWIVGSGDRKTLIGGSTRTNKTSVLTAPNPMKVLVTGRVPPVVQEENTGNYWGLNLYGDFVPLKLSGPATAEQAAQDLYGLLQGGQAHVFGNWSTQWRTIQLSSTNVQFLAGRACLMLQDGRDLYGFSTLFPAQPAKLTIPGSSIVTPVIGIGESNSRRNFQAYEIGTNQVAIYSPYTNTWRRIDLGFSVVGATFDFDKNALFIFDPGTNKTLSYSSLTGLALPRTFTDVTALTYEVQDFGITILDPGKDLLYFRAADSQFTILPGRAKDVVAGGRHSNNHWSFALKDPTTSAVDYYGISSTVRRAPVVAAGLTASETVVDEDGNDMVTTVITDSALYGYSAFTNAWTTFRGYKGSFVSQDAEDFIGRVTTSTHAYAFSPRDNKWYELPISANASVADTDQAVIVKEPGSQSVLSMQSLAWRTQNFQGTLFQDGRENSYAYSIHDRAAGGSTVWFFQNFGDRWIQAVLPNRVNDSNNIIPLEDGLLIVDGMTVHQFSGFADLSSNWAAPNDNAAYHAVPGAFARFTAAGPAGRPALLLIGSDRFDLSIPGFAGQLQVGLNGIVVVPAGAYGADGTLRFNVTLQNVMPARYRFQMLGLDPVTGPSFGRLLDFRVF